MRPIKLSASSINAFKDCPFRFRNAYVLGVRPTEDTDALRIGNHWHEILEVASLEPGSECPECEMNTAVGDRFDHEQCVICAGTGKVPDDIMEAVVRVLNARYAEIEFNDPIVKEVERIKLLYSLIGYRWYYADTLEPTISREQYFKLPLFNPSTGHPVPNVTIVGKIDKLVISGCVSVKEHKSTSKSIDTDSTYWTHLNMDTQTSMYVYAARQLQIRGDLEKYGIKSTDPLISNILYDVYHKPTISPKKLTQGDSKKFVADGMYCGHKFNVVLGDGAYYDYRVNGIPAEAESGKKQGTFTIRETPEMYGARLLQDITERPEFYFRCKPLVRTDQEIRNLEYELYDIAKDMMSKIRANRWWHNERQCEATFKCPYTETCYNHIEIDLDNLPEGMKCIFKNEEKTDG